MKRHTDHATLSTADKGACVAIGNFDGVHLCHRSVLDLTRDAAEAAEAPLGVTTFEPHPRAFFQPDAPPFRLMNADTRAHRLEKLGVDHLYELPFTAELSGLTDQQFVDQVLVWGLGVRHIVVGEDFRYGKGRSGDIDTLRAAGETAGFGVTAAPLVSDAKGEFSSTAIRQALTDGTPDEAARMLGHWHRIDGRVQKGDQRGRDLGYPTANLSMEGLHLPKFGVYAVLVDVLDGPHGGRYRGAASLGVRPTFGVNAPNLESFLFDFSGDIYGAAISVALVAYLRPEEQYDTVEALITQMDKDCDAARAALSQVEG